MFSLSEIMFAERECFRKLLELFRFWMEWRRVFYKNWRINLDKSRPAAGTDKEGA